jgi:hypothetical protein
VGGGEGTPGPTHASPAAASDGPAAATLDGPAAATLDGPAPPEDARAPARSRSDGARALTARGGTADGEAAAPARCASAPPPGAAQLPAREAAPPPPPPPRVALDEIKAAICQARNLRSKRTRANKAACRPPSPPLLTRPPCTRLVLRCA